MSHPVKVKTIIIGAGVAGLMCAHELYKRGDHDFLVLTKNIGGRIITSENKVTNYGAYFVTKTYKHLAPFITFAREMKKTDILFVMAGKYYGMFNSRMIRNIPAYIRLIIQMKRFRRRFDKFREKCLYMSQIKALESDPYLHALYFTKASVFFKENGLHTLIHEYLDEMADSMSFEYPGKASAFFFLQWSSEMLLHTLYEYYFDFEKMCHPFRNKIIMTEVSKLENDVDGHYVTCLDGSIYEAQYVVLAVEPWQAKKIHDIDYSSNSTCAYMRHIAGVPVHTYSQKNYTLFSSKADVIAIAKQSDGTYIVYSHLKEINLEHYFSTFQVLFERSWNPAFLYFRHKLVEADRGDNLFVVGSYNIDGLEDCAITGIWAARKIK